jgi:predicted permease
MARLRQDLTYALRTFAKAPGFTAIAILVLGVGIGANTAIFTIVNELLFRPLAGRTGELVGLYSHDRTKPDSYRAFSYANYADIREQSDVFDGLMAHTFAMAGTPAGDSTKRTFVEVVSSNYFDTLGVRLAAGRPFSLEEERPGARVPVVIVTYGRWEKEGRDPAFLGKTIRINAQDFTVVGVTPEGFTGTMALVGAELFVPLGMFDAIVNDLFKNNNKLLADRSNHALIVAGRLKSGLNDAYVTSRLDAFARQLEAAYPGENKDQALTTSPLPRLSTSTSPQTDGPMVAFTALLLTLSAVVLIIACLNIANMLLARGAVRRRELAMRLALGASRRRVVRQLLTEGILLASGGAALGLVLSYWATRALGMSLTAALPLHVHFNPGPDARVLAATIAFAALSTIAFGLGPALKLSRRDLVADLKALDADGAVLGRRFGARNLMVIGQVALSLALLTAGGIFARTAIDASRGNPGYSYDRLLLASIDASLAGLDEAQGRVSNRRVLDRLRAMPGMPAVSYASTVPFGDMQEGERVERIGAGAQAPVSARTYRIIGADYFKALGLEMVRGREFTRAEEESATAPRVAIIDQALAERLFGAEDPIGQTIRITLRDDQLSTAKPEPMQIVGLAPPLREEILQRAPVPHIYVPSGRNYRGTMHVHAKIAPGVNEIAALDAVRAEIRTAEERMPILALSTMATFHSQSLELWGLKTAAQLFTSLGVLALILAVVGLYGVKSYLVSLRTREIGIRMALGARPGDVLGMVLRDGLFLTGSGVALGLPLAVLVSIALTKVFVEVGGFDAAVVSIATTVLTSAALVASIVPARRATKVVPLRALRTE